MFALSSMINLAAFLARIDTFLQVSAAAPQQRSGQPHVRLLLHALRALQVNSYTTSHYYGEVFHSLTFVVGSDLSAYICETKMYCGLKFSTVGIV